MGARFLDKSSALRRSESIARPLQNTAQECSRCHSEIAGPGCPQTGTVPQLRVPKLKLGSTTSGMGVTTWGHTADVGSAQEVLEGPMPRTI